ncbi:hypothetical protein ACFL0W_06365 [Nanoarchaeota archaeon]
MKKTSIFILSLFILLISINTAFSAGLRGTGWKHKIDVQPGFNSSYGYAVMSKGSKVTQDYQIFVQNPPNSPIDFRKYFTFKPEDGLIKSLPPDSSKGFGFRIELPDVLPVEFANNPGEYKVWVGVMDSVAKGGGTFGSKAGAVISFYFRVLCQEVCLKTNFKVADVNVNETTNLSLSFINDGRKPIESLNAVFEIFSPQGIKIATITSETTTLAGAASTVIMEKFNTTGLPPGLYNAKATIDYDGNVVMAERDFRIGFLDIELLGYTETLYRNEINPFKLNVSSNWASSVEVFGELTLEEKNGKEKKFKTPTSTIKPFGNGTLIAFVDASFKKGDYPAMIQLFYEDSITKEKTTIKVIGRPKKEIAAVFQNLLLTYALIVLLLLLLVFNMYWLFRQRKASKEDKKEK